MFWKIFEKTYSEEKLTLAFEYGLILSDVAKKLNIELKPEIVDRAEVVLKREFASQTPTHLAVNMLPNILSILEPNIEA